MVAAITRPLARWLLARRQRSKGSLRGCSGGAGGGGCSLKGAGGDGCSLGRRRLSGHDDGGRSQSDCCSHGCDGGCWCCARTAAATRMAARMAAAHATECHSKNFLGSSASVSSLCKQGRGQVSSESAARLALQQAARATRAAGPQKRARYGLRSRSKRILRAPLRRRPCSAQRYARVRILSDKSCGRTRSTQCDVAAESSALDGVPKWV